MAIYISHLITLNKFKKNSTSSAHRAAATAAPKPIHVATANRNNTILQWHCYHNDISTVHTEIHT